MTARYEQAVNWLTDSAVKMWDSKWGQGYLTSAGEWQTYTGHDPEREKKLGASVLVAGTPYFLSSSIETALQKCVETLPEDFRLTPDMCPCPNGILYLEHPIPLRQVSDTETALLDHAHADLDDDSWSESLQAIGWYSTPIRHPALGRDGDVDMEMVSGLLAYAYYTGRDGKIAAMTLYIEAYGEDPPQNDRYPAKWLYSAWTFIQQELMTSESPAMDRATRWRLQRLGISKVAEELRVLYLRRPKGAKGEGPSEHIEHDCSWVVSGHWRNQWHPSTRDHRLRWIFPYIKGDVDKPLKVTGKRIYAVVK